MLIMYLSKTLYPLVQTKMTRPDMTEKIVDWDVKIQNLNRSQEMANT